MQKCRINERGLKCCVRLFKGFDEICGFQFMQRADPVLQSTDESSRLEKTRRDEGPEYVL